MDKKMRSRYREYMGGWNLWMKVLEASLLCDRFCFGGWWFSFLYINAFQPRNSLHACPNSKPVIFTLNNSNQASWTCPWTPSNAMLIPNPSKRQIWSHHSPATNGSLSHHLYTVPQYFLRSTQSPAYPLQPLSSLSARAWHVPRTLSFSHPLRLFSLAEVCTLFAPCGPAMVFVSLTKSQQHSRPQMSFGGFSIASQTGARWSSLGHPQWLCSLSYLLFLSLGFCKYCSK